VFGLKRTIYLVWVEDSGSAKNSARGRERWCPCSERRLRLPSDWAYQSAPTIAAFFSLWLATTNEPATQANTRLF
jgi:hypothetical protein